jgi:hypothetical protein
MSDRSEGAHRRHDERRQESVDIPFGPVVEKTIIDEYREQRKPMLLFVLPGVLFKFSVSTPAFAPLFQLPPRMKPRCVSPLSPSKMDALIISALRYSGKSIHPTGKQSPYFVHFFRSNAILFHVDKMQIFRKPYQESQFIELDACLLQNEKFISHSIRNNHRVNKVERL